MSRRCKLGLVLTMALSLAGGCSENQTRADDYSGQSVGSIEVPEEDELQAKRRAIVEMLGGYEQGPREDALRRVGAPEEVVGLLIDVFGDETLHLHRRTQALMALRFFTADDPRVVTTFQDVMTDEDSPNRLRRRVVRAYGEMMDDEGVELLATMLEHSDYHTRAAAKAALQDIGTPRAFEVLSMAADVEPAGEGEIQ